MKQHGESEETFRDFITRLYKTFPSSQKQKLESRWFRILILTGSSCWFRTRTDPHWQQLLSQVFPLQTQPEAHLAQPDGQQEQQLFLQDVQEQFAQAQEPPQLHFPVLAQSQGSMFSAEIDQLMWVPVLEEVLL